MSIQILGTLVIKTISGRYGDFNTAKLSTSIGEFVIKDAVLDQYTAGRYEGSFLIQQIKPSYYSTAGGTLIVEIRAYLESMSLDGFDATVTTDDEMIQDPVEEEATQLPDLKLEPAELETSTADTPPVEIPSLEDKITFITVGDKSQKTQSTPKAKNKAQNPKEMPFGMTEEELEQHADPHPDKALFGLLWPLGQEVRLDATVDRLTQRSQVARLRELGYEMDIKSQLWKQPAYS